MASSSGSGTSSGSSTVLPNSGSEGDLMAVMDQRKRKRMLSNRESARRSRMRKQKHLDELMAQVAQLRKENGQVAAALSVTTQHFVGVEAENSVLRTQMMELSTRLQSLNEILHYMNGGAAAAATATAGGGGMVYDAHQVFDEGGFMRPWNQMFMNQPIMPSAEMFQYC